MLDKQLLKTIQNDIKNIDKCIEMCVSDEGINYLKSIQKNMREQEIKLVKQIAIKKALKEHNNEQPTINNTITPPNYQGTIQPFYLINAQDLNFNLGNVVKYVCRAGKKKGENILTDLEKAKDYINFEIERVKK
jgi:hypothetical protein